MADFHDQELIAYYNKFPEEKRLNSRHGQLEYLLTRHYIDQAIAQMGRKKSLRVLDIGAGTGRYAGALAQEGHEVLALDFVPYNVGRMRSRWPKLVARQGDARDLAKAGLTQEDYGSFDLILLLGPMYHLIDDRDKVRALSQAARYLAPGGRLFVAYLMNEYALLTYGFKQRHILELVANATEEWKSAGGEGSLTGEPAAELRLNREHRSEIEPSKIGSFSRDHRSHGRLNKGFALEADPKDLYDYVRLEDIERFRKDASEQLRSEGFAALERARILSPDGPANYMRRELNALSQEEFALFVAYQKEVCERADLLGAGGHLLEVLRLSEKSVK